jgi:hypothetical protein
MKPRFAFSGVSSNLDINTDGSFGFPETSCTFPSFPLGMRPGQVQGYIGHKWAAQLLWKGPWYSETAEQPTAPGLWALSSRAELSFIALQGKKTDIIPS